MKAILFIFVSLFLTCGLTALDFQKTKKLAEGGDKIAQYNLGVKYYFGEGVPQDYKEAVKWFTKAAEQGDAKAQYNLGNKYRKGEGVPQDYKEAVKWFTKAAEQGDADAQSNLGGMYLFGNGVIEDYVTAYAWLSVAKANGNANSAKALDFVRPKMTKDQIAVGQALAKKIFQRIENKDSDNPINQRVD